jgi:hypothetical protein
LKTSIYLPDELAEQVRVHGISITEVAQTALRHAVRAAIIRENVMTDIQAVAERLPSTIDRSSLDSRDGDRRDGIRWAREHATTGELEQLAHSATARWWSATHTPGSVSSAPSGTRSTRS